MKKTPYKKALYATVAISAISFNILSIKEAIAVEINYTGTPTESGKLQPSPWDPTNKSLRPLPTESQSNNILNISDPTGLGPDYVAPDSVYGGLVNDSDADAVTISGNIITITGGTTGDVYGGYGYGTGAITVSDNDIRISDTSISGSVYGGTSNSSGSKLSTVAGNVINISDSSITGSVNGGDGNIVTDNVISISRSTTGEVYGGFGFGSVTTAVTDNIINISDGTTGDVYGGWASGNRSTTVTGNVVNISGGTAGVVYGGFAYRGGPNFSLNIGSSFDSVTGISEINVSGNTVTILGSTIAGDVYGGYIESGGAIDDTSIKATNNTVTLGKVGSVTGAVYGGYGLIAGTEINDWASVVAGNTLNLNEFSGSVAGIYNFENYNWILPKSVVNSETIITIKGESPVNLTDTKHTVAMVNDGNRLNIGDKVILIDQATGNGIVAPTEVTQGQFLIYDVDVGVTNGQFVLSITGKEDSTPTDEGGRINPRAEAFLEGRAAALGFVSQGSDLIATAGIDNIRMMVRNDAETKGFPLIPFMIMQGASNRYKTGSHADVDGFNMATGLATGSEFGQSNKVTLGAFFEYGRGTYDTYNSFTNYAAVHGSGDVNYTGGGIFGRLDFAGTGLGRVANLTPTQADGLYLEASLRAGRVSMGFDSADLIDAEGYRGNYNSKVGYLGGHASAGYVFNFDEQQALDVYARALWTRMNGDTVSVGKDTLHFDKSTSSRLQLGGRYSYIYNDQFKPYLGAAFEHEFKGDIGATAYGLRIDEPSLKGSTGIVEAGFSYMPNVKVPDLSINLNAQAFFGQRQGGSGQIKLKYQF